MSFLLKLTFNLITLDKLTRTNQKKKNLSTTEKMCEFSSKNVSDYADESEHDGPNPLKWQCQDSNQISVHFSLILRN